MKASRAPGFSGPYYGFCLPILAAVISSFFALCIMACAPGASDKGARAAAAIQSPASNASTREPAPPALFIDTTYAPSAGRTISLNGSGEGTAKAFQAALDSARGGDVIAIEPG